MTQLSSGDLAQFTGSETFFRHALVRSVVYTEGVQYLAEKAGAYWLIDKIATLQLEPAVRAEPFQTWTLEVRGQRATLTCTDGDKGNGAITLHSEEIAFTDFPLDEVKLFFVDNVILLPSEY